MTNVCIIATIVIYLVGMLLVGFVYSKSNEDSTDFYLGGRKMGPLVTAMSAEASDMSSWLLMGLPGLAYLTGIASPGWTAIGLAVGTWLNWLIVARRLRRYSANLDAITVPQFLSLRFHDQRNLLNALGAVIIIVFFIPYTASGFAACGKLFHSLFGVDYMIAMIVSALVIVGYTILGGFRAVTTTDLIQSVVMSIALVAVLAYGIGVAGGWGAVMENARSLSGYLTMAASHDAAAGTASYSLLDIVSTMAWGLGYFGMPHIIIRFMSLKSEKELRKSSVIGIAWTTVILIMSALTAVAGRLYLGEIADSSTVFITMVRKIFPALVSGLLLSAILSAAMSTADSQLLAASSAFASDVYKPVFRKKASDKEMLWAGRIVVIIIAVVALLIASNPNSGTIMGLVENAWGVFGAAFGPVILLSLFWKRFTFGGAVAGIAVGALVDIGWLLLLHSTGIYEIVPGFAAGLLAAVVVSLLNKKGPGKEVEALFDRAAQPEK